MQGLGPLALAALIWVGAHIGIAGTAVRQMLVSRLGENGFRALFSVISIGAIWFLIHAYNEAPTTQLWIAPDWLRWLLALAMLLAFLLFLPAVATPNPTAVGGERASGRKPRGVQRITRHPMLWAFSIWAGVHILGNGDTASLLFFGAFLVTALAGMPSIDAKVAKRNPKGWERLSSVTSILPFGAITAGRNHLRPGEFGWRLPLAAVALWAALLWLHPWVFGVPALPAP